MRLQRFCLWLKLDAAVRRMECPEVDNALPLAPCKALQHAYPPVEALMQSSLGQHRTHSLHQKQARAHGFASHTTARSRMRCRECGGTLPPAL